MQNPAKPRKQIAVTHGPSTWERVVALAAALGSLVFIGALIWRNEAFADPTLAALSRGVFSFITALLGGTIPGFLNVRWNVGGIAIRAGGALALFVLTYLLTPTVLPAQGSEKKQQGKSPVFSGSIVAGSEETPWVPKDAFSLMLGDEVQVLSRSSEQFIFSKAEKPFLKLRILDGALLISASIVDSSGQYIVAIVDNEFQVSQERAFNPRQPDEHTLVVRDIQGIEVLNIRYINPRVIRLVGRFFLPGYVEPVLVLPQGGVQWPGGGGISHLTFDMTKAPNAGFIGF